MSESSRRLKAVSKSARPVSKSARPVSKSARVTKPPRPRKKSDAKPPARKSKGKSKKAAPQPPPLPAASETTKHNTIPVQADWLEVVEPLIPKIPILFIPSFEPARRRRKRPTPPPLPQSPAVGAALDASMGDPLALAPKAK